jgi:hypothetical protein
MLALPTSLDVKKLSFISRWHGEFINFTDRYIGPPQTFLFGYRDEGTESSISRGVVIIEESKRFPLETRSMLWRVAEIKVERQHEWLIFSRIQNDLSPEALESLRVDSQHFLEHLRDEGKRLNLNSY